MSEITPVTSVAAVFGRQTKKRDLVVSKLGLETVGDLLKHFPRRYIALTELTSVRDLVPGRPITLVGEVVGIKRSQFDRNGRSQYRVTLTIRTSGPFFEATFFTPHFHQAEGYGRAYAPGTRGVFVGTTKRYRDMWQLEKPQALLMGDGDEDIPLRGLLPIYPLTAGIYSWDLQKIVGLALDLVSGVEDVLDPGLQERFDQPDLMTALRWVHQPDNQSEVKRGQVRFRFAEALVLQLVLARRRAAQREFGTVARRGDKGDLLARFDESLPFTLTAGQVSIGDQIDRDLAGDHPMNRLLQGEVGSGKTIVALRAMLKVVDSGGQAVLLAPTEVLAQQHHRSISAMLGDLAGTGLLAGADSTGVTLLTGSMNKATKAAALNDIVTGDAGIVIGTHALLEDHVSFFDLGLVVVDEQHRFGVEQRAALTEKAHVPPHVLVMTATPIPRTVAMTVFGDLEVSTLAELPAGRAPIQTNVVPLAEQPAWEERIWARVREEVAAGHQAYVVCPRIARDLAELGDIDALAVDEDGNLTDPPRPPAAVDEMLTELTLGHLAGLRVAPLHGRMSAEEKDRTMRAFGAGQIDVLVATTVIEVGVDVPNATMMVLMDADRFGVSQLHQLRGRVGRGGLPGLCLLVTFTGIESPARERLTAVASTTDGFELSQVDLEQRREGDVLGANQSGGRSSLVTLRVLRDEATIVAAKDAAEILLAEDASLIDHPLLAFAVADAEASAAGDFVDKG